MTIAGRLLDKIEILPNGCWEYTGGLNSGGYGNFWCEGRTRSAHIVSFEIHKGSVPNGLNVCHTCDYRPCINPDHLFLGTTQDNIDDMIDKGRDGFRGIKNGRCLLSEDSVRVIKLELACNLVSQQFIADKFGVSRSTIAAIKSGRIWGAL